VTIAAERRPTTVQTSPRSGAAEPRWPALSYLARFEWAATARPRDLRRNALAKRRGLAIAGGVVLPLLVGVLTRQTADGVFAALGALLAGLASFQGVSRTRLSAVAVAGVGTAVSTFVGATVAHAQPWALIPVIAVWGYTAGLTVSLGQRRAAVAALWPVALLIAIGTPQDPAHAAVRAGLVLAGAALQATAVTLSWATRRGAHERAALATSFRDLAAYAERIALGHARLADPNPLLPRATRTAYAALLEHAEQVRAALAALAEHAAEAPAARRLAADSVHVLTAVAETIARAPRATSPHTAAAALPTLPALPAEDSETWHWSATAVLTHLHSITTLLTGLDTPDPAPSAAAPEPLTDTPVPATLRAHLTPSGEIGRHALRLAVAAGIAETFVCITGLYEGRWIVLTVFLVLKPDYNSTVSRGVHRAIGTAVGALVGALIATLLHGAPDILVLAAGVAVAAAYAVFEVDYLRYSIYLTVFIVLLLDILGLSAETTATVRLADTALGALLALVAYAVWPTWHARTAPQIFGRLVDAHRTYVAALRHELDAVGAPDAHRLRTRQSAARRARTDAEAAAARLAAEPPQSRLTADAAHALVATATRLARAELSLHTLVTAPPATTRLEPARAAALTAAAEAALADLSAQFAALGSRPTVR